MKKFGILKLNADGDIEKIEKKIDMSLPVQEPAKVEEPAKEEEPAATNSPIEDAPQQTQSGDGDVTTDGEKETDAGDKNTPLNKPRGVETTSEAEKNPFLAKGYIVKDGDKIKPAPGYEDKIRFLYRSTREGLFYERVIRPIYDNDVFYIVYASEGYDNAKKMEIIPYITPITIMRGDTMGVFSSGTYFNLRLRRADEEFEDYYNYVYNNVYVETGEVEKQGTSLKITKYPIMGYKHTNS